MPQLPYSAWGAPGDVWNVMCWKERLYERDPDYFVRHPSITQRMRSVLIDWMSEVRVRACTLIHMHTYRCARCTECLGRGGRGDEPRNQC